jgi:hypothetical protein
LNGLIAHSDRSFSRGKPIEPQYWCQVERIRLKAIPVEESWIEIVVDEWQDLTKLPVNDIGDISRVMWVDGNVAIV